MSKDDFSFFIVAIIFIAGVLFGKYTVPSCPKTEEIKIEKKELLEAKSPLILNTDWPSISPMPDALQWWEVSTPCELALALANLEELKLFHTFLARQIKLVKPCKAGTKLCLHKRLHMREAVDNYIKGIVLRRQSSFDDSNWWEKEETSWVAITMMSSGNLEELYRFTGRQITLAEQNPINATGIIKASAVNLVTSLDHYFKQLVIGHGGPLIDRNWNKYR